MKLIHDHEWEYMEKKNPELIESVTAPGLNIMLHSESRVANVHSPNERTFLCDPDRHTEKRGGTEQYYAWRKWPRYVDNVTSTPQTLYEI